jgi:hypothetical protein
MSDWQTMDTAPIDTPVLLKTKDGGMYVGTYRLGAELDEPQPRVIAWRATCCGRFTDPVAWKQC